MISRSGTGGDVGVADCSDWRSEVDSALIEGDLREVVRTGTEIGSGKGMLDCMSAIDASSVGEGAGAGTMLRAVEDGYARLGRLFAVGASFD